MSSVKQPQPILIKDAQFFIDRAAISFPTIIKKMLEYIRTQKQFTAEMIQQIEDFLVTIPYKQVPDHSQGQNFEDSLYWEEYLSNLNEKNWLDIDFLFAETYIYREINIIIGNLVPIGKESNVNSKDIIDPFYDQKEFALKSLPKQIIQFQLSKVEKLIQEELTSQNLENLILGSISGNQADLSKWPELNQQNGNSDKEPKIKFAANQLSNILTHLLSLQTEEKIIFGYFLDNVGIELLSDLCLIDYLLSKFKQAKIIVYIKPKPLFVSDVTLNDLNFTLEYLNDYSEGFVSKIKNYQKNQRLIIKSNIFLTTPLSYRQVPKEILKDIQSAELTFFKGVFNYLKLLGNYNWEKNTPFKDVVNYFNSNIVSLNIAKSPIAVGLNIEELKKQVSEDGYEWLSSGEWALVQTNI